MSVWKSIHSTTCEVSVAVIVPMLMRCSRSCLCFGGQFSRSHCRRFFGMFVVDGCFVMLAWYIGHACWCWSKMSFVKESIPHGGVHLNQ